MPEHEEKSASRRDRPSPKKGHFFFHPKSIFAKLLVVFCSTFARELVKNTILMSRYCLARETEVRTGTKQQLCFGTFLPFLLSSVCGTTIYYSAEIKGGGGGDGEERFCLLLLLSVRTPFLLEEVAHLVSSPPPSPPLFRRESPSDSKLSLMALFTLGQVGDFHPGMGLSPRLWLAP